MEARKMSVWIRLGVAACGLLLLLVLVFPMWRIELAAPQYPEGLVLKIYANKIAGDVDVVNGLNHYIGMKTLHTEDFFEFTILPYLLVFFSVFAVAVSIINRPFMLYTYVGLFLTFAVVAMVDFWRWEYNYGHDLDPHAAIQVPGMSYQPPFLGYKQLLNFGAFSIPGTGGWIFAGVGAALLACAIIQGALLKKAAKAKVTAALFIPLVILGLSSCNSGPQPIKIGRDGCHFCKMTISDNRFGAEIVTQKGKVYKFDDTHCLTAFIKTGEISVKEMTIYFVDFDNHELLAAPNSFLLNSDALNSPMNGNIAAYSSKENLKNAQEKFSGTEINWQQLLE